MDKTEPIWFFSFLPESEMVGYILSYGTYFVAYKNWLFLVEKSLSSSLSWQSSQLYADWKSNVSSYTNILSLFLVGWVKKAGTKICWGPFPTQNCPYDLEDFYHQTITTLTTNVRDQEYSNSMFCFQWIWLTWNSTLAKLPPRLHVTLGLGTHFPWPVPHEAACEVCISPILPFFQKVSSNCGFL